MDDTAEAISFQEEISNLLSSQLTLQDSQAAERELEMLEMEEASKLELPSVPVRQTEERKSVSDRNEQRQERQADILVE